MKFQEPLKLQAQILTASNYRDLNHKWLDVKEIIGRRVTCVCVLEEYGSDCNVDFSLNEVLGFRDSIN